MFKSYEYIKYLPEENEYLYKIVDDDFEDSAAAKSDASPVAAPRHAAAAIKVYQKRNYSIDDIGLNYALFNIYYLQKYNYWTSEDLIKYQDKDIPQYNKDIKNYKEIAEARDKHFKILYMYS